MITKIDIKHSKQLNYQGQLITVIKRPKGFGDTLERFLHSGTVGSVVHRLTGLKAPCGSCNERKETLNKLLPY